MKTIIKLFMSLLMPNFGVALYIRNTIRDSAKEEKILTRKDIEGLYYLSILILIIPLVLLILCMIYELNKFTEWAMLSVAGIIISVIFIAESKDLKT